MADTDAMLKDFEQWKQDNGVVGGGTLLDRIYFAGWQKGQSRALASRPAEVDDERQWVVVGGRRAGRTFLAALARDAERYRWMRNAQWFKAGIAKTELNASSFHYSGDLLDQLIDAGRADSVHGEGAGK